MIKKLKAMINAQPQNTIFSAMYDYLIQYRNEHGNLSGEMHHCDLLFPTIIDWFVTPSFGDVNIFAGT